MGSRRGDQLSVCLRTAGWFGLATKPPWLSEPVDVTRTRPKTLLSAGHLPSCSPHAKEGWTESALMKKVLAPRVPALLRRQGGALVRLRLSRMLGSRFPETKSKRTKLNPGSRTKQRTMFKIPRLRDHSQCKGLQTPGCMPRRRVGRLADVPCTSSWICRKCRLSNEWMVCGHCRVSLFMSCSKYRETVSAQRLGLGPVLPTYLAWPTWV